MNATRAAPRRYASGMVKQLISAVSVGVIVLGGCAATQTVDTRPPAPIATNAPEPSVRAQEPVQPIAPAPARAAEPDAFEPAPFRVAQTFHDTFAGGAVAADHPVASAAGAEMLARGGNAVDAAVAASFTLSVVRPYSCGIGGGGFMVIHLANDPKHGAVDTAINYRETSPGAVGRTYFEKLPEDASTRGGHSVATPGSVAGLLYALEHYGTLDRATVLAPAIRAATVGFVVDAHYVETVGNLTNKFESNPDWQERFAFVWERFLRRGEVAVGDTIVLPEQALALSLISESGFDAFTKGPIGGAIEAAIAADGGVLNRADIRGYAPLEVEPLRREIQGKTFLAMPPPSSGGVAMFQALTLLDMHGMDLEDRIDTPLEVHLLTEAFKHAFADRSKFLADPEFAPVPMDKLLADQELSRLERLMLDGATVQINAYGTGAKVFPIIRRDDSGTSHISVVDAHGGAVACTETINLEFGSLVVVPGYGFCLNDQMDDFTTRRNANNAFSLRQSRHNFPEPGKRPVSSMSPTIVLDEDGVLAVAGASGGPRIITGTTEVLLNAFAGMDAGDAVAAPRFHHQWSPNTLLLEPGMLTGEGQRTDLEARGHPLGVHKQIGNVQLITRTPGGWQAASDPRKGGRPAGL